MTTFDSSAVLREPRNRKESIHLPLGLLGFEHLKEYIVVSNPEEAPFSWLRVPHEPNFGFLIVSPFLVAPEYEPELGDEDTAFLELDSPEDGTVFGIVTLHPLGGATINLKGPIVINRRTARGKQVIPTNAAEYSLSHPLPVADQNDVL